MQFILYIMQIHLSSTLYIIICLLLLLFGDAYSEDVILDNTENDFLETKVIVIKIKSKEEYLQELPLSITSFSKEKISNSHITNIGDITQLTPNFLLIDNEFVGSSSGSAYIRGVGQTDFVITADPGVGMYIDGVYMSRTMGSLHSLLDIERIEVLRGPQGTLYGKNTIGGAIVITTQQPHNKQTAKLNLIAGTHQRKNFIFDANTILDDKLFLKLALGSFHSNGYGRSLNNTLRGDEDTNAAHIQLLWQTSNNFNVNFSFDTSHKRGHQSPGSLLSINPDIALPSIINTPNGATTFGEAYAELNASNPQLGLHFDDSVLTNDKFTSTATGPQQQDIDTSGFSLTASWWLGDLDLKSISAVRKMNTDIGVDNDESSVDLFEQEETNALQQVSQEFQLSGNVFNYNLEWLIGTYFLKETGTRFILGHQFGDFYNAGYITAIETGVANTIDINTKNWAIFGQATYAITDKLSTTFGVRYSDEEKSIKGERRGFFSRNFVAKGEATESWDNISPRFGFKYKIDENMMAFISATKGYKSGGFNARLNASTPNAGILSYDPEYLKTYEIGFKSQSNTSLWRFAGTAFFSQYTDMQVLSQKFVDSILVTQLNNVASAEIRGFELDFTSEVSDGLTLNTGLGYIHARYTDVGSAASQGLSTSSKLPRTPKFTFNLGLQYKQKILLNSLIYRLDYSWRDKTQATEKANPLIDSKPFGLLNLKISYTPKKDNWGIGLYITNITDKVYITGGRTDRPWFKRIAYGRPREAGISVDYNF